MKVATPWLKSPRFDLAWILFPPLFAVTLAITLNTVLERDGSTLPLWIWLIFVLGIDVGHVYSTLFRTYWHSEEFERNKTLLTLIPLLVWITGALIYSFDALLFWRVLAYVAVFHFIRQQYGFMRLYTRQEQNPKWRQTLNSMVIYMAALYPMIYWHTRSDLNFHWFIDGDFWTQLPPSFATYSGYFYLGLIFIYVASEMSCVRKGGSLNVPKNLVIFGTALSWFVGIVLFNGDLIFTITNVVSHGIPYMALVWLYGDRVQSQAAETQQKVFWRFRLTVPLFLLVLVALAYVEEGFWAGLVWREHLTAFPFFSYLPKLTSHEALSILVPLLALPQATHYVLDGFIWRMKDPKARWQDLIFARNRAE